MATIKMPINAFVEELKKAVDRHDGYIFAATGQNPKGWSAGSWWYNQYTDADQHEQALKWRDTAQRVWDCNGLAEGLYKDYTGKDINTQAKYNYSGWCDPKGSGLIPVQYRVPGAAVFWGNTAATIHHVAYLYAPVNAGDPAGDWYIIEARGVMYGVVMTRLKSRNPNYWGLMSKYFDYSGAAVSIEPVKLSFGDRNLKNGSEGDDVKELQKYLVQLGYDVGRWGCDGDFGDGTELAVKEFQRNSGLSADGIVGPKTYAALQKAMSNDVKPVENAQHVEIVGGNCFVRTAPNTNGAKLGVANRGNTFDYIETVDGWNKIKYFNLEGFVSGKYSKIVR